MTDAAERFEPVALLPETFQWVCPHCGVLHQGVILDEDDAGIYFPPDADRWIRCTACEGLVEILGVSLVAQEPGAMPDRVRHG